MTDATCAALPVPPYQRLRGNVPPGSSWGVFSRTRSGAWRTSPARTVLAATRGSDPGVTFNLDHALNAFDPPMARARHAPRHELLSSHSEALDDVLHGFFPQAASQSTDSAPPSLRTRLLQRHPRRPDRRRATSVGGPALGRETHRRPRPPRRHRRPTRRRGHPARPSGRAALDVDLLDHALTRQGDRCAPATWSSSTPAGPDGSSTPTTACGLRSATPDEPPGSGRHTPPRMAVGPPGRPVRHRHLRRRSPARRPEHPYLEAHPRTPE